MTRGIRQQNLAHLPPQKVYKDFPGASPLDGVAGAAARMAASTTEAAVGTPGPETAPGCAVAIVDTLRWELADEEGGGQA